MLSAAHKIRGFNWNLKDRIPGLRGGCELPRLSVYARFPLSKRVHRYDQTRKFQRSVDLPSPISRILNAAAYMDANICDQRVCQNQGLTLKVGVEFEWGHLDPRNEALLTKLESPCQPNAAAA